MNFRSKILVILGIRVIIKYSGVTHWVKPENKFKNKKKAIFKSTTK